MAKIITQTIGKDLKIGDYLELWMAPYPMKITAIRPYAGPLKNLFKNDAIIAELDHRTSMTICLVSPYPLVTEKENNKSITI